MLSYSDIVRVFTMSLVKLNNYWLMSVDYNSILGFTISYANGRNIKFKPGGVWKWS